MELRQFIIISSAVLIGISAAADIKEIECAKYLAEPNDSWRPPAPLPRETQSGLISLLGALWRNPLEAWTREHFEQPVVPVKLGVVRATIVSSPTEIKHVLLDNAGNYEKDSLQRRMMSRTLANGLLMSEGEQWKSQRRALAPMFNRKTVSSYAPAMMKAIDQMVESWKREPDGIIRDVAADVTLLTLEVLEQTIFSEGLGGEPEEIRNSMRTYFDTIGRIEPFDLLGFPEFIPRLSRFGVRSSLQVFDRAVDNIIITRRRVLAEDPDNAPNDILTALLKAQDPDTGQGMSEAEVRANIITFIAAGHETTANTISWSLFLLSQSPEWQERVVEEANREPAGPVTRAVIEEAIRLYPPLAAISREAIASDQLLGCEIEPGSMVVISPYVLHRHRRLWDNPDQFDPNRFLGEARSKIDRYAYLPFGAGPRVCIGSGFALQEAALAVATVMKNFLLEVAPGHRVWPQLRVTLRPEGGLPMIMRRRN